MTQAIQASELAIRMSGAMLLISCAVLAIAIAVSVWGNR